LKKRRNASTLRQCSGQARLMNMNGKSPLISSPLFVQSTQDELRGSRKINGLYKSLIISSEAIRSA
jgi:hypothetical protein